jgi:hypothetical protein
VIMSPVETAWVSNDEDLKQLVDGVQHTIMKELGVERITPRR